MIGILDYGAGNVQAIARIYDNLKIPNKLIQTPLISKALRS